MAVQVRNPLPPGCCHVQIAHSFCGMRRDTGPVKIREALNEIGWRGVPKLPVEPNLLELIEQRVGLLQVQRIPKLPHQIGPLHQSSFATLRLVTRCTAAGKSRELNGSGHAIGIDEGRATNLFFTNIIERSTW